VLKTEFPRSHQLSRARVWSLDTNVKLSDRHIHILPILVYDVVWVLLESHSAIAHELINDVKSKVGEKEFIVLRDSEPLIYTVDGNIGNRSYGPASTYQMRGGMEKVRNSLGLSKEFFF